MSPQLQRDGAGRAGLALPTAICSLVSGGAVLALVLTAGASLGVPDRRPPAVAGSDLPAPFSAAVTVPANPNTHAAAVQVVVARPRAHAQGPVVVPAVDLEPADPGSTSRTPRPTSTAHLPAGNGHRTPPAPPATSMPVEAGSDGSDGSGGMNWTPPPVSTTDSSEEPTSTTTSRPPQDRPHVKPSGTSSIPGQESHPPQSVQHRPTGPIVVVHPPAGQVPGPRGSASTPPAAGHGVQPGRTDVAGPCTHGSGAKQPTASTGSAAPGRHRAGSHAHVRPQRHPAPAHRHRLLDRGVLGV